MNLDGYMTTKEAAAYLRVSRLTIQTWAKQGKIGNKIGKQWRFTKEELDRFVQGQAPAGKE